MSANIAHAVFTICDFSPSRFVYACLYFEYALSLLNWVAAMQDNVKENKSSP